jgi:hypothetical protein
MLTVLGGAHHLAKLAGAWTRRNRPSAVLV